MRLVAVTALVLLALPASGGARSVTEIAPRGLEDLAVARERVVFVDRVSNTRALLFEAWPGRTRRMREFDSVLLPPAPRRVAPDEQLERSWAVAAGDAWTALVSSVYTVYSEGTWSWTSPHREQLAVARGGAPARLLATCERAAPLDRPVMSGSVLAYAGADCTRGRVAVTDLDTGSTATIAAAADEVVHDYAVAGAHLAVHVGRPAGSDRRLDIYHWPSSRLLYRAEAGAAYDLDRDGSLLVTRDLSGSPFCRGPLVSYSPDAPEPRTVPVASCDGAQLSDGRLIFDRAGAAREVAIAGIDGSRQRTLLPPRRHVREFDGTAVTYEQEACIGTAFVFDELDALVDAGPAPLARCPVSLRALPRRVRIPHSGVVRVPLRCPRGCRAQVSVLIPSERRRLYAHGEKTTVRSVDWVPGTSGRVSYRVGSARIRRIRRAGAMRAVAEVRVEAPGPDTTRRRAFSLLP